jgi:hypothetical protein
MPSFSTQFGSAANIYQQVQVQQAQLQQLQLQNQGLKNQNSQFQQQQNAMAGAYNLLAAQSNPSAAGSTSLGAPASPGGDPSGLVAPQGGPPPPQMGTAPAAPVQSQALPNVPMPGAAPMGGTPQIPPMNASQLNQPQPRGPMPPPPMPQQMGMQQPPQQQPQQQTDQSGGGSLGTPQDHQFFQQQFQGPNGPDVMQLIKAAKTAMPDASPQERMAAVKEALTTVNMQTTQYMKQMQQMLAMTRLQTAQGAIATPEEVQFLADQYASGNQAALTRQSPATRLKVAQALADRGTNGTDAANNAVDYHGRMSEASAAGRRTGNIDTAVSGAQQIAPMALQASSQVPRSSWLAAAKMQNWLKEQSNDPALAKFQVFNLGLAREYAQAFGGTVSAQNHAMDALGTAKDQTAYKAAVEALQQEMVGAQKGGRNAVRSAANPESDQGIQLDGPNPALIGNQPPASSSEGWGELKVQ